MPDPRDRNQEPEDLEDAPAADVAFGGTATDDTTQADLGLAGGSGAAPDEGTARPYATEMEPDGSETEPDESDG